MKIRRISTVAAGATVALALALTGCAGIGGQSKQEACGIISKVEAKHSLDDFSSPEGISTIIDSLEKVQSKVTEKEVSKALASSIDAMKGSKKLLEDSQAKMKEMQDAIASGTYDADSFNAEDLQPSEEEMNTLKEGAGAIAKVCNAR